MSNPLDEYYDVHAPTSRDRLAAKQAQQQAQADHEGVPLETIRMREREASKIAERDAQHQRNAQAAAAFANAQAVVGSPQGWLAADAHRPVYRELTRRELERQRQEADEWARQHPEAARQAAEAARTRAERWRAYVTEHPDLRSANGKLRDYDAGIIPEWWT